MGTNGTATGAAERFDVVIVGARVAGSPLATLLARQGVRVAVVEQATFPAPTLSSHVIQADSLAFLDRLGVIDRIRATEAPFMTRTDTRVEHVRFTEDFPLEPGDPGGAACIRRHVLDPILAEHAAGTRNVSLRMGTKVTGLLSDYRGRVSGVTVSHRGVESQLHARLVIGADGRNSTVARLTGARTYNVTENERWYYWTYFEGADLGPAPTFVFHRWGDRHIFAGPADNGLYILGISPRNGERDQFRADLEPSVMQHAQACEPVAAALADARRATKIFGIMKFYGYFREASGPGWTVIGDAGHFKDPAAGRGIGDAFHQAEYLTPKLVAALGSSDDVIDRTTAEFGRWRDRSYAPYYWLAADLGCDGPVPALVPAVLDRLQAHGRISEFVSMYAHRTSPSHLMSPGLVLEAVAHGLLHPDQVGGRGPFLRAVRQVLATEAGHQWANRRPTFGEIGRHAVAPAAASGDEEVPESRRDAAARAVRPRADRRAAGPVAAPDGPVAAPDGADQPAGSPA